MSYQTSTNAVRQDFQALIKQLVEKRSASKQSCATSARSVFFGGDAGSPDTFQKFYADVQMYANTFNGTDPQSYLGQRSVRQSTIALPTQWQGENIISRFCSCQNMTRLHAQLATTAGIDAGVRESIGRKLNDMAVVENGAYDPAGSPWSFVCTRQFLGRCCPERLGQ